MTDYPYGVLDERGRVVDHKLAHSIALEVNEWRTSYASWTKAADKATESVNKLDAFKTQVREVAIRVADEQGWCRGGLNDVLEELGLPKYTQKYRVKVVVEVVVDDDDVDNDYDARSGASSYVESSLERYSPSPEYVIESVDYDSVEELDD